MIYRTIIVSDNGTSDILAETLKSEGTIEVVCTLANNKMLREAIEWLKPDLIVVKIGFLDDLNSFLEYLIEKNVSILLIYETEDENLNECKRLSTNLNIDFLEWPSDDNEILAKVKSLTASIRRNYNFTLPSLNLKSLNGFKKIVVIGSSTGGPNALRRIISRLPNGFNAPVVIVQHISQGFTSSLAKSLDQISELTVKEAGQDEELLKGTVYLAPHGNHLFINTRRIVLQHGPPINGVVPSADCAMISAANSFGRNAVGVILTGMGKDGAKGIERIKKAGGRTIVQDEASSAIFGMPKASLKTGSVDLVASLDKIPELLIKEVS